MQSPDSNERSSCLSRRNMILGGAAGVAATSLPKNSFASTPLSTTDQPSKNNDGRDDNMNSTTDVPETAHTFDPSNFTVVPARTFEDLRVGPGVSPAIWSRSTFAASFTLATCTFKISRRPVRSGRSTGTCRSNRPGRSRAGSSTSGRLVAPIRITPVLGSKPSNSARSCYAMRRHAGLDTD